MPHTHEYDCIVCGAHFDSSQDLHRHNHAEHLRTATGMERPRDTNEPSDEIEEQREPPPE